MLTEKPHVRFISMLLIFAFMLSLVAFPGQAEESDEQGYAEKLFDTSYVHTIDIAISEEDWLDLTANPLEKTKYKVDVTIDGETIEKVSFATKGNTSLSSVAADAESDRYSFKLNFGKYVDDQTYYGLNKVSLNNLYADATFMKDYVSYEIFRQAGVNAPLVSYVWLTINGQDHGLYIAIEDISESYLERVSDGEGVLYKPETEQLANMGEAGGRGFERAGGNGGMTPPDGMTMPEGMTPPDGMTMPEGMTPPEGMTMPEGMISPDGEARPDMMWNGQRPGGGMSFGSKGADLKYSDDDISSYSDIFDNNETDATENDQRRVIAALKALSEGDDPEAYLDTDEIIRYFAAHNFVLNYDSYTGSMLHNYYLYEREGKLAMLPWDYNLAFGAFGGGAREQGSQAAGDATALINVGIDTPLSGVSEEQRPMWRWISSSEAYLGWYHEVYDELLSSYFESGDFEKALDTLYEMLKPYVEKDPTAFYTADEFETAFDTLKKVCLTRAKSIRAQLTGALATRTDDQAAEQRIDASDISIKDMGSQNNGPDGQSGQHRKAN